MMYSQLSDIPPIHSRKADDHIPVSDSASLICLC